MQLERPDLVLVDVQMPSIGGDRLLEIANGIGAFRGCAALLHADADDPELRARAMANGADGVIVKSSDPASLTQQLRPWIDVGRQRQRVQPPVIPVLSEQAPARVIVD